MINYTFFVYCPKTPKTRIVSSFLTYRKQHYIYHLPQEQFEAGFLTTVRREIKKSYIQQFHRDEGSLAFRGTIFRFVWNGWNFLNGITHGRIEVKPRYPRSGKKDTGRPHAIVVEYRIAFTEVLVIALAFSLIPLALWDKLWSPVTAGIIWGVLYGGNYLLSMIRFDKFIRQQLETFRHGSLLQVHRNVWVRYDKNRTLTPKQQRFRDKRYIERRIEDTVRNTIENYKTKEA